MAPSAIEHHPQQQQFVMKLDNGLVATVNYREQDGKLYLVHAEVPVELRGHRVGKELVEKTFEYIEAQGWDAVAVCSYVKLVARRSRKWREIIQ